MNKIVPASGPRSAKLVIIGEAPGVQEEIQGKPFVGGSGQLLDELLFTCGSRREDCYVTNVMKIRPESNDFGAFYADSKRHNPLPILVEGIASLHTELKELTPNVLLCLGSEALRAVTGKRGIDNWRGSILSSPYGKIVPAYHPARILRVWGEKPILKHDIKVAIEESKTPTLSLPQHIFLIRPSLGQVLSYIDQCGKAERFAFDIETVGPHIRCLGISHSPLTACCIPFVYNKSQIPLDMGGSSILSSSLFNSGTTEIASYWTEEEEYEIICKLQDLFLSNVQKVAQNSPYDITALQSEYGLVVNNLFMDTMVAQHTCYKELPKGLDFLCSMYTRVPYYSDHNVAIDEDEWIYNCYDAAVTLECSYALERELEVTKQTEYYFTHSHPTLLALMNVQTRGLRVDKELRDKNRAALEIKKGEVLSQLSSLTQIEGFNPNSPKQMKELFYERYNLPKQFKRNSSGENSLTTDEGAIEKLGQKFPRFKPTFDLILEARGIGKLLGTYYSPSLSADSRLFTSLNATGTVTERLSSSEFAYALGHLFPSTNLQNPPRGDFRKIFIADDSCSLIKADLSSAEFRAVMWFARVRRIIDQYLKGRPYKEEVEEGYEEFDVHSWFASIIFGIPQSQVERKRSDGKLSQRDIAKNGIYGGNYGMEAEKAALVYHMPVETAKFVLQAYRQTIPEIQQVFWRETQDELRTTRWIVSPTGSRRVFLDRMSEQLYRDAYSHRAQHLVAYLINEALWQAETTFDPKECRVHLQVHDELVFNCKKGLEEVYCPQIQKLMEIPLQIKGVVEPLIIPAELSFGENWYDQKKWKRMEKEGKAR